MEDEYNPTNLKNEDFISPIGMIKKRVEIRQEREIIKKDELEEFDTGKVCSWCKKTCYNVYYQCQIHQQIFCKNCATQTGAYYKHENKFPKCARQELDKADCIWNRKYVEGLE